VFHRRGQPLQRVPLFVEIGVAVIDAFDATDDMS
jgi:hypothetical protein